MLLILHIIFALLLCLSEKKLMSKNYQLCFCFLQLASFSTPELTRIVCFTYVMSTNGITLQDLNFSYVRNITTTSSSFKICVGDVNSKKYYSYQELKTRVRIPTGSNVVKCFM
jgi:hypothetical protein